MGKKGSSFLVPYLLSLLISIVVGLSVLYFGFYYPRFSVLDKASVSADAGSIPDKGDPAKADVKSSQESNGSERPGTMTKSVLTQKKPHQAKAATQAIPSVQPLSDEPSPVQETTVSESGIDDSEGRQPAGSNPPANAEEQPQDSQSTPGDAEDNPLIKALKAASNKSKQRANNDKPDAEKPKNPFEFIFNQQKQE